MKLVILFLSLLLISETVFCGGIGSPIVTDSVNSSITKKTPSEASKFFSYNPSYPEFRVGVGFSSIAGSGLSVSFLPASFIKLKLTGYTNYRETTPGSLDVINSYGACINIMVYRVKFVNFYVLAGFNNYEERMTGNYNYYYGEGNVHKNINIMGGVGIGADLIIFNRIAVNLETGYHLIRHQSQSQYYYKDIYNVYPLSFENDIFGFGVGVGIIL